MSYFFLNEPKQEKVQLAEAHANEATRILTYNNKQQLQSETRNIYP